MPGTSRRGPPIWAAVGRPPITSITHSGTVLESLTIADLQSYPAAGGNHAPEFGAISDITFYIGIPDTYDLTVTDADGDTLTLTSIGTALPSGVTLDSANQRLVWSGSGTEATTTNHQIRADDGVELTTVELTSTVGGSDLPFMFGVGFAEGDVPSGETLATDEPNSYAVIKRRWSDGSVKHAIFVGSADLVIDTPKTITIVTGTPASGSNLVHADIVAAAPTASVACGAIGTVSLATLLASSPFRTWISTPQMVECHYRAMVGADATLNVWFQVRLWLNGDVWIRAIAENGYLGPTAADKTYIPTVTIDGSTVYNNGGSNLTHYANTRWMVEGWVDADPEVTPGHNPTYLIDSKLVPNFWKRTPTAARLDSSTQVYTPMDQGDHFSGMGGSGYQPAIGVLSAWDSVACTSADSRARNAALTNSSALNSYGIVWRDETTHEVPKPSDDPSQLLTPDGSTATITRGSLSWEYNHHPSVGYVPYILTGDFWHYETMAFQVATIHRCRSTAYGTGTSKHLPGEDRGTAWGIRSLGQFCAIAPDGSDSVDTAVADVADDYRVLLAYQFTYWKSIKDQPGQNGIGMLYAYNTGSYGVGGSPPWQTNYWVVSNGHIFDAECLDDMTELVEVRDFIYKFIVGQLGPVGTSNYCYRRAGRYFIEVNPDGFAFPADPRTFYDTWGQVFTATWGFDNTTCADGDTLITYDAVTNPEGSDLTVAPESQWGDILAGIAFAVDHGATGADAAWARFSGASNFSTLEAGANCNLANGFHNTPMRGIVPRGWGGT
jgi:hypothetical protein